jgi:transposase InsO family protein
VAARSPDEARYLCPNCWRNKASKKTRRPWGMDSGGSEVGKPDALLHHSDQGSQYTSEQFQRLMADSGIVCSMSRSGNVWDNAAMESFFSSMKTERTARKIYLTRNEARADVFDYIERFYNANPTSFDDRIHQPS